jgi:predicted RNA-binding protein YlqC (UPF0109 family)
MEEGLISYIARNLVNEPDKVQVNKRDTRRTTILELSVAPDDMGRVIGKSGRVANAMRDLLRAYPDVDPSKRIILEIE